MVYDEFESEIIDVTKKKQYHKCSRSCGAKALYDMVNRPNAYMVYMSDDNHRLANHIISNLVYRNSFESLDDERNYVEVMDSYLIPKYYRDCGMKTCDKYICVYRGIKGEVGTIRELDVLRSIFLGIWKYRKTYKSAFKHGFVEKDINTEYSKLVEFKAAACEKYIKGNYTEINDLEDINKLDYPHRIKEDLYKEVSGIDNIDKYFNTEKSRVIIIDVYFKDMCEMFRSIGLAESVERIKTLINYYYNRPKAYIYYMLAKKYGKDYNDYVRKYEEDGEYLYDVKDGVESIGNKLLEQHLLCIEHTNSVNDYSINAVNDYIQDLIRCER